MRTTIDLATELGESFALPPAGIPLHFLRQQMIEGRTLHPRHGIAREDDMLLGLVSTGYVACGAHAGDPVVMGRTVRLLAERGIAVGAHPSYPDIFGFGQLPVDLQDNEIQDVLLTQVAALAAIARAVGTRVSSVKCHGSLAFDVSYDERTAQVAARALHRLDPGISLVCMAGSPGARVARDCGIPVIEEAYIDRGYDRKGRIVSRTHPKALITDPREAAAQFIDIAQHSRLKTVDGETIRLHADSFCLHSGTPNARAIAHAVAAALAAVKLSVHPPFHAGKA